MNQTAEIVKHVRGVIAEVDRLLPRGEDPFERRKRELAEVQKREQAREVRKQPQVSWDSWNAAVDQRVAQWLTREFETVGTFVGEVRAQLRGEFERALAEQQRAFDAKLEEYKQRLSATAGKLPIVRDWRPVTVTYESQLVSHDGALYQATRILPRLPAARIGFVLRVLVAMVGTRLRRPYAVLSTLRHAIRNLTLSSFTEAPSLQCLMIRAFRATAGGS